MRTMKRHVLSDDAGATMIETTIIFVLMLTLTFGIAEFAHLFWRWNSAEKATQLGVRAAVVADPVATELADFDCATSNVLLGTRCNDPNAASFGTIVCSGSSLSCSGAYTFSSASFDAIVSRMQQVFSLVQPENVTVEYRDVDLGFAGREAPVPAVTVRLSGLTFNFVVLDALLGLGPITMPDFRATLTGEDLSDAGSS
jgi:hypothetical protein